MVYINLPTHRKSGIIKHVMSLKRRGFILVSTRYWINNMSGSKPRTKEAEMVRDYDQQIQSLPDAYKAFGLLWPYDMENLERGALIERVEQLKKKLANRFLGGVVKKYDSRAVICMHDSSVVYHGSTAMDLSHISPYEWDECNCNPSIIVVKVSHIWKDKRDVPYFLGEMIAETGCKPAIAIWKKGIPFIRKGHWEMA